MIKENISVTGGAGFVGSTLVDELIREGHRVSVIDSLITGKRDYINPQADFFEVDICSDKINKIVLIIGDGGESYLSHAYNDNWMIENELLDESITKELTEFYQTKLSSRLSFTQRALLRFKNILSVYEDFTS